VIGRLSTTELPGSAVRPIQDAAMMKIIAAMKVAKNVPPRKKAFWIFSKKATIMIVPVKIIRKIKVFGVIAV
jgi:hypothetical protein